MESMAEGMIKDLVASGHALADDMTGAPSVLVRCLATQLEVQLVRANALAAENALARKAVQAFCDVVGDNTEIISVLVGRDGVLVILEAMKATGNMPATDAFLDEVRASSIPEGYVLVPQQIFLEPSDIESICSQCGDGHESGYGDFTNGLLWVGNIQCDDGSIVHGLHISSADYSEEGGVTVCEFAAQLRKGGNQ